MTKTVEARIVVSSNPGEAWVWNACYAPVNRPMEYVGYNDMQRSGALQAVGDHLRKRVEADVHVRPPPEDVLPFKGP